MLYIGHEVFDILPTATSYIVTVLMTNQDNYVGKSHILMEPNQPPSGGSCSINGDISSIIVTEKLGIDVADWQDDNGIDGYKFYGKYLVFYYYITHGQRLRNVNVTKIK